MEEVITWQVALRLSLVVEKYSQAWEFGSHETSNSLCPGLSSQHPDQKRSFLLTWSSDTITIRITVKLAQV